ncbi:hypothetical protein J7S33_29670, partial [Saccharothrix algeriensis]
SPCPPSCDDRLARTRALRPAADGGQRLEVPRYIRRAEWFTDEGDLGLAGRYPEGVRLRWDAATGVFTAVARDGTVLARLHDVQGAPVGHVPGESG